MTETTIPRDDQRDEQHDDSFDTDSATALKEVNVEDYEAESPTRHLTGFWMIVVAGIAIALSLYALYATRTPIATQVYRTSFLAFALVLTFLLYPAKWRGSRVAGIPDVLLTMASIAILLYPLTGFSIAFTALLAVGAVLIFLIYPACLLYTSPSPRDGLLSRMPSSA